MTTPARPKPLTTTATPIATAQSLADFFLDALNEVIERRKLALASPSRIYAAQVLSEAAILPPTDPREQTLAMMMARANEASGDTRLQLLRALGDRALCVSGWFHESLRRTVVSDSYYTQMGATAYAEVGSLLASRPAAHEFSALFDDLAAKFRLFVDLFREMADRAAAANDDDLIRLYERYLATRDETLRAILTERGVMLAAPSLAN